MNDKLNTKIYTNFELLMSAACELSVDCEAADFLALDNSNVTVSPKTCKRIERIIRNQKHGITTWGFIKVACVACLLLLSAAFTACMCVPKIRETIRSVVIEWYDEYISVDFRDVPADETSAEATNETEAQPEPVLESVAVSAPPTTIEQKAYAAYLPEGYYVEKNMGSTTYYLIYFVSSNNQNSAFTLNQTTIKGELWWADSEGIEIKETNVKKYNALYIIKDSQSNSYILLWQDGIYEYTLSGSFSSYEELIKIAENIQLSQ